MRLPRKDEASVRGLRDIHMEVGVKLIAHQMKMTVDLFDYRREDLIDENEPSGAATMIEFAGGAHVRFLV